MNLSKGEFVKERKKHKEGRGNVSGSRGGEKGGREGEGVAQPETVVTQRKASSSRHKAKKGSKN